MSLHIILGSSIASLPIFVLKYRHARQLCLQQQMHDAELPRILADQKPEADL